MGSGLGPIAALLAAQHMVSVAQHVEARCAAHRSAAPAGHLQVPPVQASPPGQSVSLQQSPTGMQEAPHSLVRTGHLHVPLWQVLPPEQSVSPQQTPGAMHDLVVLQ